MLQRKPTLRDVKVRLIGDSIDRRRQVERLIQLIREDERKRVTAISERAKGKT